MEYSEGWHLPPPFIYFIVYFLATWLCLAAKEPGKWYLCFGWPCAQTMFDCLMIKIGRESGSELLEEMIFDQELKCLWIRKC